MTTDGHGLTDAECDAIRRALPREVVLTESRHEYECGLIRAAYAAGAASVSREPTRAMLEVIQSPELLRTFAEAAGFKCDYRDVATMNWRAMHDAATGEKK